MWSQLLLCLLVGLAYASQSPAWKENNEYVYQIRARSLAGLNQISNNYTGIILRAKLHVRPKSDGNLDAKISSPQFAEIQTGLTDGWDGEIPEETLDYHNLPLSSKPFRLEMIGSSICDLIVDKEMNNWEANIIKSIVSQLQLDTNGTHLINSHYNMPTQDNLNSAVFKTMESTVSGISETLYDIHPLPDYVLQRSPWLVPVPKEGENIEVVKDKNFTFSPVIYLPSYHFGLEGVNRYEPDNKIADFATRTSQTRAVITGNLDNYVIQSIVSVDEIVLRPTMVDEQKGSVSTMVNVTLESIAQPSGSWEPLQNTVNAGLVYIYDDPFDSNQVKKGVKCDYTTSIDSAESQDDRDSLVRSRLAKRKVSEYLLRSLTDYDWNRDIVIDQPQISQPAKSPLLPFTVGYNGQAISKENNMVEMVNNLAEQIGQELQNPEQIPSKNTIGKFVIMKDLVRLMTPDQMRQLSEKLHTKEKRGLQSAIWQTYRDAVAQSGSGPAFTTINEWIINGKIENEEAAHVVASSIESAQQPTEEYMREFFFKIIQNDQIMVQPYLNESALMAYTHLLFEACSSQNISHSRYPVHSFGRFCDTKGVEFVKTKVIFHLKNKLKESINNADTRKIHIYIRALGNIAHRSILSAFKPYLEGQQKSSQYQRLLMVVALDRLVRNNPKVARSVLYKVYQNPTEDEQVRAAAVFQLMRTNPPPSMLQRMATYTNDDPNHYVNAAVKSAIESASQLEGEQHAYLRSGANSAKHLLTNQQYGEQYDHQRLRHHIVEEMKVGYHYQFDIFNGADHLLPKGIKFSWQGLFGGVERRLMEKQAIVSSVDDLFDVFQQQTKEYRNQQDQKNSQSQHPWSSEHIAELLKMIYEPREQLEGNMYLHENALHKIWSFDNHTIENLTQVIAHLEDQLRNNKLYDYNRMMVNDETIIAFPTALGVPFIYTFERPVYVRVEADVKLVANPPMSSGKQLEKPKTVDAEYTIRSVVSGKLQSQFGFFTPFTKQRYSAGYDKNFQMVLPLKGKIHWDLEKKQAEMQYESADQDQTIPLLHFSTWPYTAKYKISDTKQPRQIIKSPTSHQINEVIGKKSMGIVLEVKVQSDKKIDVPSIYRYLSQHNLVSALIAPWPSSEIQHSEVNVVYNQQQSSTKKVTIRLGYQQKYRPEKDNEDTKVEKKCDTELPDDFDRRQEEAMYRVSNGIRSVEAEVLDVVARFQDNQEQDYIRYYATVAGAKSNVDPNGNVLAVFKRNSQENLRFCVEAKTHFPNTNGLNLDFAMNMDTKSTVEVQTLLSRDDKEPTRISADAKFFKSKERLEYFQQQQVYKDCKNQMAEGNNQLPACAKATAMANLLDQFQISVFAPHLDPRILNSTYQLYSALRHRFYPRFEENIVGPHPRSLQNVEISGHFGVDLNSLSFYLTSFYGDVRVDNLQMSEWAKHLLVPHPVFHVKSRLMAYRYKYDAFRPICVVDKTGASTFDNRTFPATIANDWTVLLQWVPRRPLQDVSNSLPQQLKKQIESYIVYVRSSQKGASQKDLKMVVQSPETDSQNTIEIDLRPRGGDKLPKLYVNQNQMVYNDQGSLDFYNGYIQIYALPNNEVKVEVRDVFYAIYDDERVKLTALKSKFMDASRGLCGTFTGEQETDFTSTQNCIIHDAQQFVDSYVVPSANEVPAERTKPESEEKCYRKEVKYVGVISNDDEGIANYAVNPLTGEEVQAEKRHKYSGTSCTKLQTQYVVDGGEICFTLRQMPVCREGCRQEGTIKKNVAVHCVERSAASNLWRKQIDRGANPDFSNKSESRTISIAAPQRCLQ